MIYRPPHSATATSTILAVYILKNDRTIVAGATPGVYISAKPKPSRAAMRQAKYRAHVAEGRRCYTVRLNDAEIDALIAKAERLLDRTVIDDAQMLNDIEGYSRSDFVRPSEFRKLGLQVIERHLKTLCRK